MTPRRPRFLETSVIDGPNHSSGNHKRNSSLAVEQLLPEGEPAVALVAWEHPCTRWVGFLAVAGNLEILHTVMLMVRIVKRV